MVFLRGIGVKINLIEELNSSKNFGVGDRFGSGFFCFNDI